MIFVYFPGSSFSNLNNVMQLDFLLKMISVMS